MTQNRTKRWGFLLLFTGLALAIPGVWMLLAPNRYEATVRIKVTPENDFDDESYNPYFIQTEFEILKSDAVLGKVVEGLRLDEQWSKRYANGHKLEMPDAIRLLKQSLYIMPVRNTMLVDISFTSEEPPEAANVANAIAQSYFDHRRASDQQMQTNGLAVLNNDLTRQEQTNKILHAQVDTLKQQLNPPNSPADNPDPKYEPYWDAVKKMAAAAQFRNALVEKIDDFRKYSATIEPGRVVSPAVAPKSPMNANRRAGKILLLTGILAILAGTRFLSRAYFAAPRGDSMMMA